MDMARHAQSGNHPTTCISSPPFGRPSLSAKRNPYGCPVGNVVAYNPEGYPSHHLWIGS